MFLIIICDVIYMLAVNLYIIIICDVIYLMFQIFAYMEKTGTNFNIILMFLIGTSMGGTIKNRWF